MSICESIEIKVAYTDAKFTDRFQSPLLWYPKSWPVEEMLL